MPKEEKEESLKKYWPLLAVVVLGVALMWAISTQRPRHAVARQTATAPTAAPVDVHRH